MNLKNATSLILFFGSFMFSVLAVDFLSVKTNLPIVNDEFQIQNQNNLADDWATKKKILQFLEEDRQNGRELVEDLFRIQAKNKLIVEETATVNLLRKMRRMNYLSLPPNFRVAWKDHVRAWDERANFLGRVNQTKKSEMINIKRTEDYRHRHHEINRTYKVLIKIAEEHGVKFSY